MLLNLWDDDAGIVALEYLLLATIVGLGLVVGMSALSEALNVELTELGNSILALDEGYTIAAQRSRSGCGSLLARRNGTATFDQYNPSSIQIHHPETPVSISLCP
jgi:Flp pilus assembly pilin Flp